MKDTLDILKPVPGIFRNAYGLRPQHAQLYLHLKECADKKQVVNQDRIIEIYFNYVKNPRKLYVDVAQVLSPLYGVFNKDMPAWGKKNMELHHFHYVAWVKRPAVAWMQQALGSLVMRGFLTVIPNFDPKLLEDIPQS